MKKIELMEFQRQFKLIYKYYCKNYYMTTWEKKTNKQRYMVLLLYYYPCTNIEKTRELWL